MESTKQIEKAIDVMREISPIPVLPKNEVEGFCYDAERQELVFCAAIPPQELLQRLPAEIVMAAAESSYAGISENELMRQTAAAISVEVCGRLGLPMPPDVVQTLEGMKEHIPDGEERRALEKSAGNGSHLWGCRVQVPETGARSACSAAGRTVMPNALQPHR